MASIYEHMLTGPLLASAGMFTTEEEVKARVRGWILYKREELRPVMPLDKDFAELAGMTPPQFNQIKNGKGRIGLLTLARMRERLHMDINIVLDMDAPERGAAVRESGPEVIPFAGRKGSGGA